MKLWHEKDEHSLIDEIKAYQDGILFDGWWRKRNVLHSNYLRYGFIERKKKQKESKKKQKEKGSKKKQKEKRSKKKHRSQLERQLYNKKRNGRKKEITYVL